MQLKYKVNPIKDFIFKPTEITLYIGNKETIKDDEDNDIEVVNIQSDLVQYTSKGKTTETQNHKLPVSILSAFNGFDFETMQPTVDLAAVNAILMSFNLELDESEAK